MSSQRGNASKKGPQKYQNKTAFKNNLHDASPKIKMLNNLIIVGCCQRCKEILDWKIKFKKYKVLTKPKKCVKCFERRVTNSYYIICSVCSTKDSSCGKCGEPIQADVNSTTGNAPAEERVKTLQMKNTKKEPEECDSSDDQSAGSDLSDDQSVESDGDLSEVEEDVSDDD